MKRFIWEFVYNLQEPMVLFTAIATALGVVMIVHAIAARREGLGSSEYHDAASRQKWSIIIVLTFWIATLLVQAVPPPNFAYVVRITKTVTRTLPQKIVYSNEVRYDEVFDKCITTLSNTDSLTMAEKDIRCSNRALMLSRPGRKVLRYPQITRTVKLKPRYETMFK